jgi:outer membrane receptor protein involved in Fe transport
VACALVLGTGAAAQETSSITGTVTNAENNKPVADVVVTAESPALPSEQIVVTNAKGQYTVENLPPGTYTLRFEGPQYRPFSRAGVAVRAGTPVRFDVQLAPDELQEEVIVTGSRIPRPEVATAAPVTVVGRNQIETAGRASIGDILQQLPSQGNATNTQVNNGGSGATRINLRNLGTARTLVLVNGRRFVAGGGRGADASVDLNAIPTQAIERIEVLKDGASAAYGSDAIAGVVNVITRKDFSGTEFSAFGGMSSRADALQYDLSATTGLASEKGNLLFSAGFFRQNELFAAARPWGQFQRSYNFTTRRITTSGSDTNPNGYINDTTPTLAGNSAWTALKGQYPTSNVFTRDPETGAWRPYSNEGVQGYGGDQYNAQPINYMLTPNQRVNAYSTGGYKFAESVRGFYELSYTSRSATTVLAPEPLSTINEGVVVSGQNVYNPFGRNFSFVARRLEEFGGRKTTFNNDTFRVVTGVEGSAPVAGGLNWDASFNYGRTSALTVQEGNLQRSKVAAALGPSFIDAQGVARCGTAPTATTAAVIVPGCVPLNLFGGQGSITPDQVKGLAVRGIDTGFNQQLIGQANVNAQLFRLFDARNPIAVAAGYEHRREAAADLPNPLTAQGDITGNKREPTQGSFYVNEGYAELSVPVLGRFDGSNAPGDFLEVNAAIRGFNFSNFGSGSTYKFGAQLSPIQDVTLRATYSNAFRAPTVVELFGGQSDSFPSVTDPCSGWVDNGSALSESCKAQNVPLGHTDTRLQQQARVGGNPALQPETARTLTAGIVIQPRVLPDFSATVDIYNFRVAGTITAYGSGTLLSLCHPTGANSSSDPVACGLITREASGLITRITDLSANVGALRTKGVDIGLRYEPQTAFGRIGLRADLTYLDSFRQTFPNGRVFQGQNNFDLGVLPDWRGLFGVSWALNPFNAGVNVQWLNGVKECAASAPCNVQAGAPPARFRNAPAYFRTDLNLGVNLGQGEGTGGRTTFNLGVSNLFDVEPPRLFTDSLYNTSPQNYDLLGRYFFGRLSHSFY